MSRRLIAGASSRRQFLRLGSSLLALPWLESLAGAAAASGPPRRLVAICNNFGFYAPSFDGDHTRILAPSVDSF